MLRSQGQGELAGRPGSPCRTVLPIAISGLGLEFGTLEAGCRCALHPEVSSPGEVGLSPQGDKGYSLPPFPSPFLEPRASISGAAMPLPAAVAIMGGCVLTVCTVLGLLCWRRVKGHR